MLKIIASSGGPEGKLPMLKSIFDGEKYKQQKARVAITQMLRCDLYFICMK
jgi:hypothetical protein